MEKFLENLYDAGIVELYIDDESVTINTVINIARIEETEDTFEIIDPESNSFLFNKEDVTVENADFLKVGNEELTIIKKQN